MGNCITRDSANGMFGKLCSIYERDNSHNKSSLLQNFFNYKIDKVVSGLSDLQNLSMKLKSVGHTVDDEMMIDKILSSLPDRFRKFLTAWESTLKSERALTNLTARLLADEERNCMKKQLGCKICKQDNDTKQNCYFRDRKNSTTSNRDKVAFITEPMGGNPERSWVFDSGCTSHMINNSDSLTNITALLFDSALEKELQGEALCTETYLLNRSPSAAVDTTPAELLYGKRPDLSNLKLFGLLNSERREFKLSRDVPFVESTEVSATNNSSQEIFADTVSLVNYEGTSLRLADNMQVKKNTTVLQDDVVEEPFHVFPSDQETAKTSEMLDSLPETATEIENCNHQGRKERIKIKPQYLQEYVMLSYKETISGEDKDKWLQVIEEEKSSLKKNGVFQFVNGKGIPRNQKLLSSRWVFKIKNDNRYKARLVTCGYEPKAGLDYSVTFSSVVSLNTLRFLMAHAKKENMSLKQFDI
ncbi:hypothetical protein PR048_016328 [Dryococelus australis]|uniref:Reverse transcriptase Ty1/copia-type domain-containing protein n=1 Tax=Dryococelus australis TaxID=614101 RepID=A0ABQ9HJF6_9NEOP|nr:hypothetical protein PR048_016328 [Dryococelus australis]